ncbi:hypothetical protein OB905_09155 [Halobacteria archaeon AArc-dxtr1]|nr:hypothetical protein [Halobacteria archaeon AArc-dxtr1]
MTTSLPWDRSIHRSIHVLFAVALGSYLYSPLSDVWAAELLIQGLVFPGLALSGMLLWKEAVLRRWIRTHRSERSP